MTAGPLSGALGDRALEASAVSIELAERVCAVARSLGFDAVGIARADRPLDDDIARYDAFVAAGMHGEMTWLAEHRRARERLDGEAVLPGARSVICLAKRYRGASEGEEPPLARAVARYARGQDYHKFLRRKVRRLASFVRTLGTTERPAFARPLCDDAPVLERAWAARAGLGFVGKNGMLIIPGTGSMALLGEVVTTLALATGSPMSQRCGSCTRCLDACPTGAFVAPFVLDARKCVSYLTIEHRSEVAESLRERIGGHLFGCDECQTVCPFNAGTTSSRTSPSTSDPFASLERWAETELSDFLMPTESQWDELCRGSPLKRAGRAGMARNAAIVLGNAGDAGSAPALREAATAHPDPVVRDAASWALDRIADKSR
jgi:epoxyqueuosine reductase